MGIKHFSIKPKLWVVFFLASSFGSFTQCLAYDRYGSVREENHILSVGGGIASPSVTSALGENPAGLSNNQTSKILGQMAAGNDELNPLGYGGGFFFGNGSVGGGVALQGFNNNTNGSTGSILLLNWGLAADIPGLNIAWGFTGTRTIRKSGEVRGTGSGTTWCVDTGIIFNPKGDSRVGFTLFQVLDDIDAVGAGWAYDLSAWATFALDATYTTTAKTTVAKPALSIQLPGFQISSGYGVRVQGDNWSWIRQGLSLGVGVPLGRTLGFQAYYNQLALYYGGLTIAL
jgi:hypothetical protein